MIKQQHEQKQQHKQQKLQQPQNKTFSGCDTIEINSCYVNSCMNDWMHYQTKYHI